MPQVKVGWRSGAAAAPSVSTMLLDVYSGAAAAYSLRKLSSTYTGSAIRVRRSSDNTESNIGFDSDGNLDTYALSAFVGSGNGFVTTWYDQSGSYNLIQTTAANQPSIILSGSINTQNGKPVLITDGSSFMVNNSVSWNLTTNSIFATIKLTSTRGYVAILSSVGTSNQHFVSRNVNGTGRYYDSGGQEITAAALPNGFNLIGIHENTSGVTVFENGANLVTNFAHDTGGTLTGIVVFRRDNDAGNVMRSDSGFSELVIYGTSKLSDNSVISNNINTYYSAYPNPTSVWNLLAAAYSADTIALPSLKTSLVAAYNGESNANDSFGANNGTAVGGLTYGTGKIGNAFNFNGTNAYVALPVNSFKPTNTDFSISAWVNFSGTSANVQTIFSSISAIGGKSYGIIIYYYNNRVDCQISNASVNDFTSYNTTSLFNSWNLITFTRKAGSSSKLYINGSLVSSNSLTNNPTYPNNTVPSIGAADYNGTTTNQYFCANGTKIDAFNIWQKELTISEITELYNSGNGAQYIGDNFYKPTTNDALLVNNGTAQGGLTYGLGKVGTAFQFNGTNAYVSYGDNFDLGLSSWTYTFWTIPTSLIGERTFFSKSVAGPMDGRFYAFAYHDFLKVGMQVATIGGAPNLIEVISTNVIPTSWTMMTIVFDRSDKIKCYFNGNQIVMTTLTGTNNLSPYSAINYNTSAPFRIGAYTAFDGVTPMLFAQNKMDAFNIWNRALTQSEITELYNSGNGKQYPN